jgi:hypothetical protein
VDNPPLGWDDTVESGIKDWKGRGLRAVLCKYIQYLEGEKQ